MHLASKRHKKQQGRLEDPKEDTIVYAEDLQEDSSGGCPGPCPCMPYVSVVMLCPCVCASPSSTLDGEGSRLTAAQNGFMIGGSTLPHASDGPALLQPPSSLQHVL